MSLHHVARIATALGLWSALVAGCTSSAPKAVLQNPPTATKSGTLTGTVTGTSTGTGTLPTVLPLPGGEADAQATGTAGAVVAPPVGTPTDTSVAGAATGTSTDPNALPLPTSSATSSSTGTSVAQTAAAAADWDGKSTQGNAKWDIVPN